MHKYSLGDEVVTSSLKNIITSKDVMKPGLHYNDHVLLTNDGCLSPPGLERTRCESIEPPPGFESVVTIKSSKKAPGRPQQVMERRMTRSQKKGEKSNSPLTSESMIRLAKESLEIGKILGVKVIANEKAALWGITSSLKEAKKKRNTVNGKIN